MIRKNENIFEKTNLTPMGIELLRFLARNPDKEFYIKELAKLTDISIGGSYAALKKLYKMNLIDRRRSGYNLYYKVNEKNPALKYFKLFVNIQELNGLANRIKGRCNKIVLFGRAVLLVRIRLKVILTYSLLQRIARELKTLSR